MGYAPEEQCNATASHWGSYLPDVPGLGAKMILETCQSTHGMVRAHYPFENGVLRTQGIPLRKEKAMYLCGTTVGSGKQMQVTVECLHYCLCCHEPQVSYTISLNVLSSLNIGVVKKNPLANLGIPFR